MPTENPKLTISLTGRRPVTILKAAWPIIAIAERRTEETSSKLIVRKHEDGRSIVYGIWSAGATCYPGVPDVRGGELLEPSLEVDELNALAPAIVRVGEWMADNVPSETDKILFRQLTNQCIADLPAEEIS
jgi:hypothetical protein